MKTQAKGAEHTLASCTAMLDDAAVGPSEWYLYFWLFRVGLLQKGPAQVTVSDMRYGIEGPVWSVSPARLALNTIKSALANLEEANLITIEKTEHERSRAVTYSVTFV